MVGVGDHAEINVRVAVTQNDIEQGERHKSYACPVARAIRRALRKRGIGVVLVEVDYVDFANEDGKWHCPFPDRIARWIERYDASEPVKPTWFDLVWR